MKIKITCEASPPGNGSHLDLRNLHSALPEAECFELCDFAICVQFFPAAMSDWKDGYAEPAKQIARRIGGDWKVNGRNWETSNATWPGLRDVSIVLHYIEPEAKAAALYIDLGAEVPA